MTTPNLVTYVLDRGVLSVVRALPDILYALVFVAAVGVGPLPGILALGLFNIGVVAKLTSETVDGIDTGPIEAARASGGNRLQTVRWADQLGFWRPEDEVGAYQFVYDVSPGTFR